MSINHFSSSDLLPETLWWSQHQHQHQHQYHNNNMESSNKSPSSYHNFNIPQSTNANFWTNSQYPIMSCTQNSAFGFDLNNHDDIDNDREINHTVKQEPAEVAVDYGDQKEELIRKQPLFEKPLTPSDVGKLNRLVIPKQHAEKYFPLNNGNNNTTTDSGEKGLLLSFEDELGKPWRFRYSYWNSSQSYVLTKGWSRFVKEKKLDAGDVVLFERHPLDSDRLFIGWRRRNIIVPNPSDHTPPPSTVAGGGGGGGSGGWTRLFFSGHPYPPQPPPHSHHGPALPPYQPDCLHAARVMQSQTTQPARGGNANSKKLRLFGVNLDLGMECQREVQGQAGPVVVVEEEEEEDYSDQPPTPEEGSSGSSQTHHQAQYQYYHHYFTNHELHHTNMDINFSRDVNQTKYHQG